MGYAREYAADGRKIYQIGCNFSSKTGTIDGWKMKWVICKNILKM
ncbi:PD-(D/E)XK nuclease domain-containing protein [Prevotella copri]|nr:PD-(D/E)XK nuclease domain-containing protein [Segatella copri]MCP9577561.1 PD-(D/E)XK nuclease domain-containing protein [Segatella copri]MCP9580616.1 PD-(D/E)XK nuclease domain-containing protein [Segatella copri]MCP9583543.1 PD-(D/E)XK nuclease domain-containing protein [Segatella copri]MCP9586475.1 PD-(D/E)XK nuclease domain-containing protein [Segatella copri]